MSYVVEEVDGWGRAKTIGATDTETKGKVFAEQHANRALKWKKIASGGTVYQASHSSGGRYYIVSKA